MELFAFESYGEQALFHSSAGAVAAGALDGRTLPGSVASYEYLTTARELCMQRRV